MDRDTAMYAILRYIPLVERATGNIGWGREVLMVLGLFQGASWTRYVRSAALLQQGLGHWDGPAAVGMVAGSVALGLGNRIAALGPQSDGTVALAETRVPGLRDHCLVRASHSGLLFSPLAARQTAAFLRHGRFAA